MAKKFKPATKKQIAIIELHENIAAISAELWSGKATFYERHGHDLNGFPGVWRYSVDAAIAFTWAEKNFIKTYGTKPEASYEYLDAILRFAEWLSNVGELPTDPELRAKAAECILDAASFERKIR